MFNISRRGFLAGASALTLPGTASFAADSYPSQPIKIEVPFAPGLITDLLGRSVANVWAKKAPVPILVENRPGASSAIAARWVKNADPDGYTLLFEGTALFATPLFMKEPGYVLDDFTTVGVAGSQPVILVANSDVPSKTLDELVEYSKAHPGDVRVGTTGPGSAQRMSAEMIQEGTGVQWSQVVYKGGSEVTAALLGGEIQVFPATANFADQLRKYPNINHLAVMDSERFEYFPEVPTFSELGYKVDDNTSWYALAASSKVPAETLDYLRNALHEVTTSPEMIDSLKTMVVKPYKGTIDQYLEIRAQRAKDLQALLDRIGIQPQ